MVNFSCKDCPPEKRNPTCHVTCKSYLAEVAQNEKEKKLRREYMRSLELHSNGTFYSGKGSNRRK